METCTEIQTLRDDFVFMTYGENCHKDTLDTMKGFCYFSSALQGSYFTTTAVCE